MISMGCTSWSAPEDNAADTFINASQTTGPGKTLGRLETRFDRVEREKQDIDGCSSETASLRKLFRDRKRR